MKQIKTNRAYYEAAVKQGLWKEVKKPSYFKMGVAVAEVEAKLKGCNEYIPAIVYIENYYNRSEVSYR